jgi:hypothetical protein
LLADVTIDSLQQWGTLLAKLGTVTTLTEVTVPAMDTGMARLSLVYVGTADQLHDNLANAKVDLEARPGGGYTLALQDDDAATPAAKP